METGGHPHPAPRVHAILKHKKARLAAGFVEHVGWPLAAPRNYLILPSL